MSTLTRHPRNSSRQAILDNEQYTQNVRGLRPGPSGIITIDGDLLVTGNIVGAVAGAATLADTLIVGNTTGANDIVLSVGTGVTTAAGRFDQSGTNVRLTSTDNLLITGSNIVSIDSSFGSITLVASVGDIGIVGQNYNVTTALDTAYSGRDYQGIFARDVTLSGGGGNSITMNSAAQDMTLAAGDEIDMTAGGLVDINAGSFDVATTTTQNFQSTNFTSTATGTMALTGSTQLNLAGSSISAIAGADLMLFSFGTTEYYGVTSTVVGRATSPSSLLGNGITVNSLPGSTVNTALNWNLTANGDITTNAALGTHTQNAANIISTATGINQVSAAGAVTVVSTGAAVTVSANTVALVSAPTAITNAATKIDELSPIVNLGDVANATTTNVRGLNLDVNVANNIDLTAPNFDVVADISSFEGSEFQVNVDRFLSTSPVMPTVNFGSLQVGSTNLCGKWTNVVSGARLTFNPPLPANYRPTVVICPDMSNNDDFRFLRWMVNLVSNTGFEIRYVYVEYDDIGFTFQGLPNELEFFYQVMCFPQ